MWRGGSPEIDKILGMGPLRNAPVETLSQWSRPLLWIISIVFRMLGFELV